MYDERKETFSFRSFFLTLLLLVLFILLMLFLFPTRWEYKKACNSKTTVVDKKKFEIIYDEIFTNNILRMKDVAVGYYTESKLPKKLNESDKLTLGDMYDKHLILKIKDKDGKECNKEKSYSEVTNTKDGYKLKVNLSCGSQEEYVIFNLYDSNYCVKTCEVKTEPTQQGGKEPVVVRPTQPQPQQPQKPQPQPQKPQPQPQQPQTTKISVTGISLSKTQVSMVVGSKITLTATVKPSNATNRKYTWKSSNTNVATVQGGIVTGISAGTATITVTTEDGAKVATCKITVTKQQSQQQQTPQKQDDVIKPQQVAVTSITASSTSVSMYVGDSVTVSVTVAPSNATNKTVTWKSNNTGIATVSNGVIKGVKVGTTTVVATTSNGKTVTINVTVKAKPQSITTYKCKIVNNKYYDSTGKVVDLNTYIKSCNITQYEYAKRETKVLSDWSAWTRTVLKGSNALQVDTRTVTITEPKTSKNCETKSMFKGYRVYNKLMKNGTVNKVTTHTNETCPCNTCGTTNKTFRNIVRNSDGVTCSWQEVETIDTYGYEQVKEAIYNDEEVCTVTTTNEPKTVTEYRSRKIEETTSKKWSIYKNDTTLTSEGYKLTGVTK